VEGLRRIAEGKSATVAQVAIVWVLAQGKDIILLAGTRRPERLREALGVLDLDLMDIDIASIEGALPQEAVAGNCYDAAGMTILNSEKKQELSPGWRVIDEGIYSESSEGYSSLL
jgi:diketogulonate reductase-like aldo/keto reductase